MPDPLLLESLRATLDAADDVVMRFDSDGRLVWANRKGTDRLGELADGADGSIQEMAARVPCRLLADEQGGGSAFARALRGDGADLLVAWRAADGRERRSHVQLRPLREGDGPVAGVVLVSRDVTLLHQSIARDAALATARRCAHELNNRLQLVLGLSQEVASLTTGEAADLAREVVQEAAAAGAVMHRFLRLQAYAETSLGGVRVLDLDAAAEPPGGVPRT